METKNCIVCGKEFKRGIFKNSVETTARWRIRKCCSKKCVGLNNLKDITGKKFAHLKVIKYVGGSRWLFKCDCGKEKIIKSKGVVVGRVSSCGCMSSKLGYETKHRNGFKHKDIISSHGYVKNWDNKYWKHRYQHQIIAERILKRNLLPFEDIHHIDGDKTNNSLENLMLVTTKEHMRIENGWEFIDKKWFKTCFKCKRYLEVDKNNFYYRKSGKIISPCKKCQHQIGGVSFLLPQ